MPLTLANRTIPSSCLSLITLSPRPAALHHRSCAAFFNACPDKLSSYNLSFEQQLVFPGFGPTAFSISTDRYLFLSNGLLFLRWWYKFLHYFTRGFAS